MSVPNTRQMKRRPTHPGEMLREDFMPDYGLTVVRLAAAAGVSPQSINELLRGRRAVSPEMAIRLAHTPREQASALGWSALFTASRDPIAPLPAPPAQDLAGPPRAVPPGEG